MKDATTTLQKNPATIRLSLAQGLHYKAYARLYDSGTDARVLTLLANGYHTSAPWELFFTGVEGKAGEYNLMEKVPHSVFTLTTWYSPSFCSGLGMADLGTTVTIHDGYGSHTVEVENF